MTEEDTIQCCRECAPESGELAQLERVGGTLLCPNCGHLYTGDSDGGEVD